MIITIEIPEENEQLIKDSFKGYFGIPQIDNPEYDKTKLPSEQPDVLAFIPQYTEEEWVSVRTKQFVSDTVNSYKRLKALQEQQNNQFTL